MATIEQMMARLGALEASGDQAALSQLRQQLCAEHPEHEQASIAHYQLGIDLLMRCRQLAEAAEHFAQAAAGGHPGWSAMARTSLGLCWLRMGRAQQGMLELRRVAFVDPPSVHSANAMGLLQAVAAEAGDGDEVRRLDGERLRQLQRLAASAQAAGAGDEEAFALYHLALILRQQGAQQEAQAALQRAHKLGAAVVGEPLYADIGALL